MKDLVISLHLALDLELYFPLIDKLILRIGAHIFWNLKLLESNIVEGSQCKNHRPHLVQRGLVLQHFIELGARRLNALISHMARYVQRVLEHRSAL